MNEPANLLASKKVLVADDDAINHLMVMHTLTKLGSNCELVHNGKEVIDRLASGSYDLILMDIQMPEMDGYEATLYIRQQMQSKVPIVAMTAFALKGEEEKCLDLGMDAYVAKPFTTETLTAAIKAAFSHTYDNLHTKPHVFRNDKVTVDISILYDVAGDDPSYINTMLRTFTENMPVTLHKIEEGLEAANWDGVYRSAHYAKSSLSIIKVTRMLEIILLIEKNARTVTDVAAIPGLLTQAREVYNEAERVINSHLSPAQ